jgi:hypothetical protein
VADWSSYSMQQKYSADKIKDEVDSLPLLWGERHSTLSLEVHFLCYKLKMTLKFELSFNYVPLGFE